MHSLREVAWGVVQVTIRAAWWLNQVEPFTIDFKLIYYAYMYIIIILKNQL